jgi:hypothetical protein
MTQLESTSSKALNLIRIDPKKGNFEEVQGRLRMFLRLKDRASRDRIRLAMQEHRDFELTVTRSELLDKVPRLARLQKQAIKDNKKDEDYPPTLSLEDQLGSAIEDVRIAIMEIIPLEVLKQLPLDLKPEIADVAAII